LETNHSNQTDRSALEKTPLFVEMRGIVKRFPGVLANDHVDFDLKYGEIHALLGENGAGKSTLMNILAGLYQPDGGTIRVKDKIVNFSSPRDAIRAGIGMHTGPLIMGITGDENRLDAATISDTVNTAARIESLTKYYKSPLLLSGETLRQINDADKFQLRHLGKVQLKGKHQLLSIVECINGYPTEIMEKKTMNLSPFSDAMNYYWDQQFENAISAFRAILTADPEDRTAAFFMDNALDYCQNGVPDNWTGAVEMLSK